MNFTKEELKWIKETRKNLKIGNILDELNQRAHSYLGGHTKPQEAQEQALRDFHNYVEPGEYVATTDKNDFKNHIYFKKATS